jgi:hypothetical protein
MGMMGIKIDQIWSSESESGVTFVFTSTLGMKNDLKMVPQQKH